MFSKYKRKELQDVASVVSLVSVIIFLWIDYPVLAFLAWLVHVWVYYFYASKNSLDYPFAELEIPQLYYLQMAFLAWVTINLPKKNVFYKNLRNAMISKESKGDFIKKMKLYHHFFVNINRTQKFIQKYFLNSEDKEKISVVKYILELFYDASSEYEMKQIIFPLILQFCKNLQIETGSIENYFKLINIRYENKRKQMVGSLPDEYNWALKFMGLTHPVNMSQFKRRYYQLAKKLHPDLYTDEKTKQKMTNQFKLLQKAKTIILKKINQ